jgi:hypothetical protein
MLALFIVLCFPLLDEGDYEPTSEFDYENCSLDDSLSSMAHNPLRS